MAIEGYIRKRPDTGYWESQIHAGKEFRRKFAYEQEWSKWRDFYRGNWAPGVMPLNLFYMFVLLKLYQKALGCFGDNDKYVHFYHSFPLRASPLYTSIPCNL